jgi:hypothetical protein
MVQSPATSSLLGPNFLNTKQQFLVVRKKYVLGVMDSIRIHGFP